MIILNEQQERIKNEAVHWFYHSSEQVFEAEGQAGVGKSVLISAILRELKLNPNQVAPMAFTGAAIVSEGPAYGREFAAALSERQIVIPLILP